MSKRAFLPQSTAGVLSSPYFWLVAVLLALVLLLCLPLAIPIGPMYWDSYFYLDVAQRIWSGQVPGVDFSLPVGPLTYYLFAWGLSLFPHAQPLLLAQWSMLVLSAPLMALALSEIPREKRYLAFALLIPFLVFAIFPINAQFAHTYPSVDGFGTYNRQAVLLLYVLVAGLLFLPDGRKLAVLVGFAMLGLFLTKVTGFLVGGLFCLFSLFAGRISLRNAALSMVVFVAALVPMELYNGIVSGYVSDILGLIAINRGTLLPRFFTVVSTKLDFMLAAAALTLFALWMEVRQGASAPRFLDRSLCWLAVTVAGGVIYETQNAGSQEFIFVWPVILLLFERSRAFSPRSRAVFLVLAAFCAVPTFTTVVSKGLRALAVAPTYVRLDAPLLRNMQQVSSRPDIMARSVLLEDFYADHAGTYEDFARVGQLPSWQLYSELDFQMHWLVSVNGAAEALTRLEAEKGVRFDTLMSLDFANPFPWILNRGAPRYIAVAGDPGRNVPEMSERTRQAIEGTDAVLRGKCPVMTGRVMLEAIYADALRDRQAVPLNRCWDLLVRPDAFPALVRARGLPAAEAASVSWLSGDARLRGAVAH